MRSHATCARAGWRVSVPPLRLERRLVGTAAAAEFGHAALLSAEPGFGSGRTAERQVWEVLRDQLPADAALLHSVTMIERATEYEADLVVGWPGVGVAVIEVKGGHISRDQGQSYQSSGGETHPVKDPVAQAQDPGDWTAVRRTFRDGYVAPASWFRWCDRSACALVPRHDVSQAPGTGAVPPGGA